MSKMTAKRVAAEACARTLNYKRLSSLDSDTLYSQLEADGYLWNLKAGAWERGSTSMFQDADGEPTGLIRLRVMGNPADLDRAVELIRGQLLDHARLVEVSDHYSNRRGPGCRIYATLLLADQPK